MNRERIDVFKRFAQDLALLSKCEDRKVATVITDSELLQVYSIGVNGGPKGFTNCLCVTDSKYSCIHSEINALIKCKAVDDRKVMFITLSPCEQCAAAIINAGGFERVFYMEDWKDNPGVQLLEKAGIYTVKI